MHRPSRPGRTQVVLSQLLLLVAGAVVVGAVSALTTGLRASSEAGAPTPDAVNETIAALDRRLDVARGELDVTRLQLERATEVMKYSTKYQIPADLSAAIYDIALAEGIHPTLGFELVRIESRFRPRARSHKDAIGYTQLRILTARGYDPDLTPADLYRRDVNLRIGFRYLKDLLRRFDGDLSLALVAYNRGPTVVDSLVTEGSDPSNGYAEKVMAKLTSSVRRKPAT